MKMTSKVSIKVGVNTALRKDGKVLLGKRLKKVGFGMWGLPAGLLEFGESIEGAAKRELFEETGLKAVKLSFFNVTEDVEDTEHWVQLNFLVDRWTGNLENKEPEKCEGWEWFGVDKLPEPLFYGHEKFLRKLKESSTLID